MEPFQKGKRLQPLQHLLYSSPSCPRAETSPKCKSASFHQPSLQSLMLTFSGSSKSSSFVSFRPKGIIGTLMDSLEEENNLFGGWFFEGQN